MIGPVPGGDGVSDDRQAAIEAALDEIVQANHRLLGTASIPECIVAALFDGPGSPGVLRAEHQEVVDLLAEVMAEDDPTGTSLPTVPCETCRGAAYRDPEMQSPCPSCKGHGRRFVTAAEHERVVEERDALRADAIKAHDAQRQRLVAFYGAPAPAGSGTPAEERTT